MPPPEVGVIALQAAERAAAAGTGRPAGGLPQRRRARAGAGRLLQRRVYEEGSDVQEGQVLFLIDPAQLQAALGQSEAALAQAQATYANAKTAADRARQLLPQRVHLAGPIYDNALAAERSAAAAVQQAKAGVETARINRGYATVRAPISGRAGKQQVTEGALVGQGDATLLTTVDQIDPLYVELLHGRRTQMAQVRQLRRWQRPAARCRCCCPTAALRASGHAGFLRRRRRSGHGRRRAARARAQSGTRSCCRARSSRVRATLGEQHDGVS